MRRLSMTLLTVLAIAGCGSNANSSAIRSDPRIKHDLQQLDSVLKAATAPVPAQPSYKVSARALRLHGLELWSAIVDPMLRLERLDNTATARAALNHDQYVVYALFVVDADIENGGLWQLYFNNSGAFANQAPNLLVAAGAPMHAAVLTQANRVTWPSGVVPSLEADRRKALPQITTHRYDAADAAWTRADTAEDTLDTIIERYVRAHPSAFLDG